MGNPSLDDIKSPPTKQPWVYICVIFHMVQLLAMCVWLSISWLSWLNAGRYVGSLKQQKHSGILVARYPRIYKEIIICDPNTNLKAKPNRNTLRFQLRRYHVPVDVTMISIALPISFWRRELRYQDRTEELPRSSAIVVHQFTAVLSNSITDSGIT